MKKIISLLLAAVMLFSLSISAAAFNVTMKTTEGHTYTAYQVFSGDLTEVDGSKILSNVVWGDGVDGPALLAALKADATYGDAFAECEDAAGVADVLAGFNNNSDEIAALAKIIAANKTTAAASGDGAIEDLDAGYYLILDTTDTADMPDGETYSDFILEVVSNVEVDAKDDSVSSQKKVKDTNDSTGETSDWQDSADYDIDDDVPFQLTATIANDFDKYETYKLVFHDTQCDGLTLNADSFKAYADGEEITGFTVVENPDDDCTFEVVFDDLTEIDGVGNGSVITVEYTSKLNDEAAIGAAGNPNEMYVEYSNNPNADVVGIEPSTGKTPKDKVIVFTYQVKVNKVEKEGDTLKPLTGAAFTLYKEVAADAEGAQTGAAIKAALTQNNGSIKADALEDEKSYIVVDQTSVNNEGTIFDFKGVDDGNYVLVETTIPESYNACDALAFTVSATHDTTSDDPKLQSLAGGDKFTGDAEAGILTTDVENKKGNTLPSTGGIGTTIFYVLGGLLVAFAAILLITRKRMSAHD